MSDPETKTPRCDAAEFQSMHSVERDGVVTAEWDCVPIDFARELERALAASEERVAQLTKERDALRENCKTIGRAHALALIHPCEHRGKIVSGYKNNYAIAWCDQCGQITDCSDGSIPDKAVGRDDHALWSEKHIVAFGCQREADGPSKLRCESWCGHHYCPTTSRADGTKDAVTGT